MSPVKRVQLIDSKTARSKVFSLCGSLVQVGLWSHDSSEGLWTWSLGFLRTWAYDLPCVSLSLEVVAKQDLGVSGVKEKGNVTRRRRQDSGVCTHTSTGVPLL